MVLAPAVGRWCWHRRDPRLADSQSQSAGAVLQVCRHLGVAIFEPGVNVFTAGTVCDCWYMVVRGAPTRFPFLSQNVE